MGSVLLSRCKIGSDTIIGARALVTEEVEIPSGVLALGMPARVLRPLNDHERAEHPQIRPPLYRIRLQLSTYPPPLNPNPR